MPTLPAVIQQNLPPELRQALMLHDKRHQQLQIGSRLATDQDLIDAVKKQWKPHLFILNYFRVDSLPRPPFTRELTNMPPRSKYYETFLCTCVFIFAILLVRCVDYLLTSRKLRLLPRSATWLQFCILTIPFTVCVLDFPVKNYAIFSLTFNAICVAVYLGCRLHKRLTQGASSTPPDLEAGAQTDAAFIKALENGQQAPVDAENKQIKRPPPPYNDLLAIYRSIVYISTAVCIFARDQPCWNNDFSKTHSFGTGLMDVGIGCFVVCIGSLGPTASRRIDSVDRSQTLRKAALQSVILTACGLVKTISVAVIISAKKIQYDAAWAEYGVHWNAFYSLAVARGLGATLELLALPRWLPPLCAALISAVCHEALLAGGLAQLVLAPGQQQSHNRSNLIGQNREGLASIPGLITLYFCGLQLGRWLKPAETTPGRLLALMAAAAAVRPLTMASDGFWLLPESRRLMNPAYCAWLLAFSCFCLCGVWLVLAAGKKLRLDGDFAAFVHEGTGQTRLTPIHLQQVDSAGLLYFLVSNLLTGLFNLIISWLVPNRESLDGAPCFVIVLGYTLVTFSVSRLATRWFTFRDLQTALMRRFWRA
ncbi:hypothetical protein BOX15_Mlig023648g3 [Macrostomum lignano]|nr:hypothetical protein BOX15_Mlig023648g3 [Macrostomum lignano]